MVQACGNIFNEYFCSTPRKDYDDPKFNEYVNAFDDIFYEVNNGRAMDFLPWLKPFMSKELNNLKDSAEQVRSFVEEDIIKPKRESKQINRPTSVDFLDGLMDYIDEEEFEVRYFLTYVSLTHRHHLIWLFIIYWYLIGIEFDLIKCLKICFRKVNQ